MAKPPTSIPPTTASDPLQVTLIIGSFTHSPLKVELFDLLLPASQPAPQHPEEASFHPLPAIHHTFRPDPKLPPKFISAVFAGLVVAPWLVLLGLVRPKIALSRIFSAEVHSLSFQWGAIRPAVPHLFSVNVLPFLATLGAFEGLLFWYWVDLKLGQVLLYGAILSIPTLIAGNQALSTMGKWRSGRK